MKKKKIGKRSTKKEYLRDGTREYGRRRRNIRGISLLPRRRDVLRLQLRAREKAQKRRRRRVLRGLHDEWRFFHWRFSAIVSRISAV